MKNRLLWLLVFFLMTGCGFENENKENEMGQANRGEEEDMDQTEIMAELEKTDPLVYEYQVRNETEAEIQFDFSSSQRYDFSISTKDGEQVYLYSSTASFLQVLGEERIGPGEHLAYTIDCHTIDLSEGEYILTVWLTPSEGKKFETSQEFDI